MATVYKQQMLTQMVSRAKAEEFVQKFNNVINEEQELGYELYHASAWISANDEDLHIYRDVDDYTVHAVISIFSYHRLAHITYTTVFKEIWAAVMGDEI
jgi:hypothetical protein